MKQLLSYSVVAVFASFLMSASCKKDDKKPNTLPPATQEGKNTFGCMVNGEVYLPKGTLSPGGKRLTGNYSYANFLSKHVFAVNAYHHEYVKDNSIKQISIKSDNFKIEQGKTYSLHEAKSDADITAQYIIFENSGTSYYNVIDPLEGELSISKLDTINHILSGTFWFDALNDNGDKVEVRDGRFDIKY